ncbi:MAG: UDP-N-acetylmuramyl-tripeptide synthetase [Eggerthellaceae bacterium]|nr:UDP-N-acetylmuramyl-tripeptide synthetase [Eggerthellaceae bacterium]
MPESRHVLKDYLDALSRENLLVSHNVPAALAEMPVTSLSYDSRAVEPSSLFICKGAAFRTRFLADALKKGAIAYVAEDALADTLAAELAALASDGDEAAAAAFAAPCIRVSDIRAALVALADTGFDRVADRLIISGITGTKGKSTTTYYMRAILDDWMATRGKPASAVLSSIDNYDGVATTEAHLTTPEVLELYRHFQNAVDSGISHLTMEVSSQSLMTGRVNGITFEVGAWLNIDIDHISPIEHASFEDYFAAKLLLFDRCRTGVVNLDARFADRAIAYAKERCPLITFGQAEGATVHCTGIRRCADGIHFTVESPAYNGEFAITMPGLFNVTNALCAMAICNALGVPEESVRRGLLIARASGRMQVYSSRDGQVTVIVDYAHNRLSFEALLDSTRVEYPDRKIIWVFGCPGNHAQNRRSDLPGVIGKSCEMVYICEEDSAMEPFADIAAQVAANVESPYEVIEDRSEALRRAIFEHEGPRVILFTGKGEERYMKRPSGYDPCESDVDITLARLAEYDRLH